MRQIFLLSTLVYKNLSRNVPWKIEYSTAQNFDTTFIVFGVNQSDYARLQLSPELSERFEVEYLQYKKNIPTTFSRAR
jgi:hypothetical protein